MSSGSTFTNWVSLTFLSIPIGSAEEGAKEPVGTRNVLKKKLNIANTNENKKLLKKKVYSPTPTRYMEISFKLIKVEQGDNSNFGNP